MLRKNTSAFVSEAREKYGDKFDYSLVEYVNTDTPVKITCPIHGLFMLSPYRHLKTKTGCTACGRKLSGTTRSENDANKVLRKNIKHFLKKAIGAHGDKFDYSLVAYVNTDTPVKIICRIHGVFKQVPWAHYKHGCSKCKGLDSRKSQEDFIKQAKNIHPQYDYSNTVYISHYSKLIIECSKHGPFTKTPENILQHKTGCPSCGLIRSSVSKRSQRWLDSFNNPNIIREHPIKELNIFVDGYDPETKTVYEFHGDYWHGNPKKFKPSDLNKRCKKTFGELYSATIKREDRIREAGYGLTVVWDSEWS